ncbi:phage gene 29 protein family protein [Nocardia farcinica]|uniref:phage gene 29 protein family protein n=1 Tax=Nocardia farcinica TaxID=37329 RepID=UPI00378C7755
MSDPIEHPIFREGGDQEEMLTALLDAFPGQPGAPDVMVPIHPRIRPAWAKALLARGVRVHPELMDELPVVSTDHPEAGWLQPMAWVSRAKYAEQQSAAPASTPEQQKAQMEQMLQALDPHLAEKIAAMSDAERRAEMAAMAAKIPHHIAAVADLHQRVEAARKKEQPNG